MSLWYALPTVMLAYSAAQWVRRKEHRAKTISRALFWLLFIAYVRWDNGFTLTILILGLGQWFFVKWLLERMRKSSGEHLLRATLGQIELRPLTEQEQKERSGFSEKELRGIEFMERVEERRFTLKDIEKMNKDQEKFRESERRKSEREERKEQRVARELEQMNVSACADRLEVRFTIPQRETFPSADGGEISVEPNDYTGKWKIEELEFDETGSGGRAICISELKFRNTDGREWKVKSHFRLDGVLDLERFDRESEKLTAKWWRDADEKTTAAMRDRCVIAGLVLSNDCRVRFPLVIGGKKHCIMLKYLSWRVDAALSENGDSVIVRVRELHEELYDRDIFDETDSTEPEFQDMRMVKPFFYELPVEDFLPLFRKDAHFADRDALDEWDGESPRARPVLDAP